MVWHLSRHAGVLKGTWSGWLGGAWPMGWLGIATVLGGVRLGMLAWSALATLHIDKGSSPACLPAAAQATPAADASTSSRPCPCHNLAEDRTTRAVF
eukprot:12520637-Alexandrium_andersonii.AAC.1